jgi:hypothetical protein
VVNYAVGPTFGLKLMKRPSDDFIGTLLGLLIFLLAPSRLMYTKEAICIGLILFAVLGAIVGTVFERICQRRS